LSKKIEIKKNATKVFYQYYLLNSCKQIINNFRIKLSKLFCDRNKYLKTNKVKIKVQNKQIIININKKIIVLLLFEDYS